MTRWVLGLCGSWDPICPTNPFSHMELFPSSPVSRVVYNGKRNSSPRSPTNSSEIFTPAHEENVRFIYEGRCPWRLCSALLPAWVNVPPPLFPLCLGPRQ